MKRKTMYAVCGVALLLTAAAQAIIPSPMPPINVVLEPNLPGQLVDMRVSGTWPDHCRPLSFDVVVGAGPTMWIDLILSSVYEPNCPPDFCGDEPTTWEVLASPAGPFPAGLYSVYARAVDCNAIGPYELVLPRLLIGEPQPPDQDFGPGQRVVLLNDDLLNGLLAGQGGTVICCDNNDCSGQILVSWDLWAGGKDDLTGCAILPILSFPANSVAWADPNALMTIARPFNQCGTIREGLEGCVYFEADNGRTYDVFGGGELYTDLATPGGVEFDQRLRLQGLLDTAVPGPNVVRICPVRDGDIYHPILSRCQAIDIGCCGGDVFPGDRVRLLADEPTGPLGAIAVGLGSGTDGTVICCESPYGPGWVFVSWDGYTNGINADTICGTTIIPYVRNSGWWIRCSDLGPVGGGSPPGDGFVVRFNGNAIRLEFDQTAPNPQQTLIGCLTAVIQINFRAELSVEVTATSAADGTWTGTITPEIVEPGTTVIEICVRGENVDLTAVPPGENRQLASLSVFAVPAP